MRSYYEHLQTAMGNTAVQVPAHPILRSSAIFPVFQRQNISSRILFLGYWILKRNIREILTVVNLRSEQGTLIGRRSFTITEPKTYNIELNEEIKNAGLPSDQDFLGSLEVEFYSTVNLVFPYPATVINYYGPHFSTVVHTAQRVYNDVEDMQRNTQTKVPESGFNIYAEEGREPFISLINGPQSIENEVVKLEVFNSDGEVATHAFELGPMGPYETKILYPARDMDLKSFLKGKVGAAKAYFQLNWIFPRLVVGNIQNDLPALTITHSYYDCTEATSASDYWRPEEPDWYPASLMVPLLLRNQRFTNIYFYPIYSPSKFLIDLEIYNESGNLLGTVKEKLIISSPSEQFYKIDLKTVCKELDIPTESPLGARIVARTLEGNKFPARVKLGLDLGGKPERMPCNICTNLQPFNPSMDEKPSTFKWGPVLSDQPGAMVWIMNSGPAKEYNKTADIHLTFYRSQDTLVITRKFNLEPHGFRAIFPNEDPELRAFLHGTIGWYTMTSSNAYTTTYYFDENPSGIIGGDHGF